MNKLTVTLHIKLANIIVAQLYMNMEMVDKPCIDLAIGKTAY